ncbi:hypothetical protein P3T36_002278 [Kitasatospora sp. MAP12-15]|nr:hypothetical protein [Kitasatospora sp. MAP12-44]
MRVWVNVAANAAAGRDTDGWLVALVFGGG